MAKRISGGIALSLALIGPAWPVPPVPPTSALIGTPPQPSWSGLTAEQRAILEPLGKDWDGLENFRRKKWLGIAERYSRMPAAEQQRVQARMREWVAMTPEQRSKVRNSYKEFSSLPAEKKQAVRQKWEAYSSLTEEEKNRLKQDKAAARAAALNPPPPAEAALPAPPDTPLAEPSPAAPIAKP